MKKSILVLLLILTGLTMCCAVSAARSDISGDVYKLLSFAGVEINSLGFSEDMMVVTLYPDGTASVSEEGKDADTGSWTLDGNDITISTGGDSLRGTLEGDTLTLNIEGADFVLVKETPKPAEENEPSGFSRLVSSIWSSLTGKNKEPEPTPTEIPQPTETPAPLPTEESSSSDAKSKWADLANTVRDSRDSVENEQAAADDVLPAEAPAAGIKLPASFRVGDVFKFGHYEQDNNTSNGKEPIEWQVLAVENGRVLVISKYALDAKPFNETKTEGVTWETCTLRSWLNSEFLKSAFSSEEQNRIQLVTNRTPDHEDSGNPGRIGYGGNDTKDRIFLLSIDEARQYFGRDFSCEATAFAEAHKTEGAVHITSWWLRSTGLPLYGKNYNAAVCGDDMMYGGGDTVSSTNNVVRPAFWLDLKGSADSGTAEQIAVTKPTAQPAANGLPSSFRVGDLFTFGHYEQDNNTSNGKEPIQWQVLAVENGQALVISKFALDGKRFNETGYTGNWETSTLQKWLNADFRGSAFSMPEQALIAESIFLLSRDEANRYFGSDLARQCKPTAYAESQKANTFNGNAYWWLRSADASGYPDLVIHDGSVNNQYANDIMAVRPAFRLDPDGTAGAAQSAGTTGLKRPDAVYTEPAKPAQTSASSESGRYVDSCRMKSYLKPGDHAEVVTERGLKLRKKPAGTETGVQAFAGKDVEILDGPVCRNGSVWFEINFLGYRGWSMEGLDGIYYLRKTDGTPTRPDPSPKRTQPTPRPTASSGDTSPRTGNSKYSSRLKIGDTVEVINTGGLQLYMTPNGKYYDGVAAWPGKAAKVTDGPQYDKNGSIWWEIDFLGHRGWVLEVTTKGTYYLEKK